MLQRPQFKPHWHVEVVEGEGVFLLSEQHQTVLQGRLYELVAPRLDGRPTEEICRELRDQAPAAQVFYTLGQLERKGYLLEHDPALPTGEAALLSLQRIDPAMAAKRLAETTVSLLSLGDIDASDLGALLESLDVRLADDGHVAVVVADHYLRRDLERLNAQFLETGRTWMLVKPVGSQIWVGPVFVPGETGCWECLAQRIRANSPIAGYLDGRGKLAESPSIDRARTAATLAAAWGLAATSIASWIAQGESPLKGKIQTLDILNWKTQTHTVLRQPTCPICAGAPTLEQDAQPIVLRSMKKTNTVDGGHRVYSPQETLDRYAHHVSPISGVVPMLERSGPTGDGVMHVFVSGNNIARGSMDLAGLRRDLRNSSCGKGTNDLQAKASALCEAIERYSAIFRGDEPRKMATLSQLGDAGIHPNDCMLFSERQYQNRHEWNGRYTIYHYVPGPFDPGREVEWTPVWSLTQQRVRYLPTAFCYFSYPQPPDEDYCVGCSNGNAAGNTLEEAILQGFFELVERDSVALWWYNRVRAPGVDLDSFNEPYIPRLRAFLRQKNRDLWVLDITSDLGIPVFVAISRRLDGAAEQIMFGFGAHLDPHVALMRAITELNQMLVHILDAPPEGPTDAQLTDVETVLWLRNATLAGEPYLVPSDAPPRTAADYPTTWTDDIRDDVLLCQARVEAQGLEMLVLDQTRPELGMPVVKVIVPGLRHFWARFAPGRLYDVPVRMNWLPQALTEEQLNPVPMFL